MKPENHIWVFTGAGGRFPSAVFSDLVQAEVWIEKNKLTGLLGIMPMNQGVFDWAIENDAINMKSETLQKKKNDPGFIGTFTTGSLEHYHYENGSRE